jgi:membrane protease YdiL (CAAX protease family)
MSVTRVRATATGREPAFRPRVLWPFLALLVALVLGAVVVLGPLVGSGMQDSVGPLATVGWLVVSAYAVGMVWLVLVRWQRRDPASLGFHQRTLTVGNVVAGTALGVGAITLGTLIAFAAGGFERTGAAAVEPSGPVISVALVAFVLSSVLQEVFLVSGLMTTLRARWTMWPAILLPGILFALFHLGGDGSTAVAAVNEVLFAITAALLFFGTGDRPPALGGPIAFHTAWNVTITFAVGVSLSGTATPWGLFGFRSADSLWSGGAFGIEGGLGGTLALAAVIAGLVLRRRLRDAAQPSPSGTGVT